MSLPKGVSVWDLAFLEQDTQRCSQYEPFVIVNLQTYRHHPHHRRRQFFNELNGKQHGTILIRSSLNLLDELV